MKWFDNWFRKKCKQAWETPYDEDVIEGTSRDTVRPRARLIGSHQTNEIRTPNTNNGTSFILSPATGGNVLEVRVYDEKLGENKVSLHLIPCDQDLGESIGRIITIEALKR